jgi:ABC-type branched-subunit amino acid transport system substrate-binding protein
VRCSPRWRAKRIAGIALAVSVGYFDIDLDTAWRIASESMPLLAEQVRALLSELEGGSASPDQPIAEEATAVCSSPTATQPATDNELFRRPPLFV